MRNNNNLKENLLHLISFMAISARNLESETKIYGSLRLVDSVSKLIVILEKNNICNEFLSNIKAMIDSNKCSVIKDEEEFLLFLDKLILKLVEKLKETE